MVWPSIFDDDLLVGDVEVAADDFSELPVLLGHVVQDNGVSDDAVAAAGQPDLEVLGIAGQPDRGAAFGETRLCYRAYVGLDAVCRHCHSSH